MSSTVHSLIPLLQVSERDITTRSHRNAVGVSSESTPTIANKILMADSPPPPPLLSSPCPSSAPRPTRSECYCLTFALINFCHSHLLECCLASESPSLAEQRVNNFMGLSTLSSAEMPQPPISCHIYSVIQFFSGMCWVITESHNLSPAVGHDATPLCYL